MPIPAVDDRRTGLTPERAIELLADARFIEKTPFTRRLESRYTAPVAAIVRVSIKCKKIVLFCSSEIAVVTSAVRQRRTQTSPRASIFSGHQRDGPGPGAQIGRQAVKEVVVE
jgi:hypothetical protein